MATRDDVLDAIDRIEMAGGAGEATRAAQVALTLPLPAAGYDRILNQLRSAWPMPGYSGDEQQGRAAQAMKQAEAALAQQLSVTAEFDRQVIEALRHAYKTTLEGRRRLDGLEAEITGAAQAWDLSTAAGAREFQRFLIGKLSEIAHVVEDANDDDTSKRALAAALTALYAAQSGSDDPAPADREREATDDLAPASAAEEYSTDPAADPYLDLLDPDLLAGDEPGAVDPTERLPQIPSMPTVPGMGADGPGFGAMPAAMPAGLPLAGLTSGLGRDDSPDEDEYPFDDAATAGDATSDESDGGETDGDGAADRGSGPVTVRLPDGATTSVVNPQLAAAMQAAADGQPVADAFRRQGIDLPPPGTPVVAPVDATRLRPGDIGVFTDRHALAVGDGRALLDGQVHLVDNLRGPGFLGWQHPPVGVAEPDPVGEPAPTRPATAVREADSLKIPDPTAIVE